MIALLLVVPWALADVSFDESSGMGFVGKGDVQLAFGWNNKDVQANGADVFFTYEATDRFDVGCTFETGMGMGTQTVTNHKTRNIDSAVVANARKHSQIDGFVLTGMGEPTGDVAPQVGDYCPNGGGGTITDVRLISSEGGLYVHYGETSVLLPETTTTTTTTSTAPPGRV
jgi:hypothetical protein